MTPAEIAAKAREVCALRRRIPWHSNEPGTCLSCAEIAAFGIAIAEQARAEEIERGITILGKMADENWSHPYEMAAAYEAAIRARKETRCSR